MKSLLKWTIKLGLAVALAAAVLGPGAEEMAAQTVIRGELIDSQGKPFSGATVVLKSEETGQTFTVTTDSKGHWQQVGVRAAIYAITIKLGDKELYTFRERVLPQDTPPIVVNFQKLIAAQQMADTEALKKQQEEAAGFENMKKRFDAGVAALDKARLLNNQMQALPREQRETLADQVNAAQQSAVTELEAARSATRPEESNRHIVVAKLAEAYEAAGKYDQAVTTYQEAISLKPDQAGYYNNLGNALAKAGKIPEAQAAYQKSADLDPGNAWSAWLNYGIVLRNTNRMKEAIEPLQKATKLNPNQPLPWFLLGGALLNTMETKTEGDKLIAIVTPGTAEAFAKYLELAPNGPFAADAQASLESLKALGAGIDTKVSTRKGRGKG